MYSHAPLALPEPRGIAMLSPPANTQVPCSAPGSGTAPTCLANCGVMPWAISAPSLPGHMPTVPARKSLPHVAPVSVRLDGDDSFSAHSW